MKVETLQVRNQIADEGKWLYRESADGYRTFTQSVLLGKGAEPWPECTEQERLDWQSAWDAAHPADEPEPNESSDDPANEGKEAEV